MIYMGRPRPVTRLAAMLGRTPIALLAGVFAIAIGGCGGSDDGSIPSSDSTKLLTLLSQLQSYVSTGDCALAEDAAADVTTAVQALPDGVDPDVETALAKGADHLAELTKDPTQCTDAGPSGETGVQTTETTSTTSTETSTTESTSTPDETTPSEDTGETPPTGTPPGQDEQTPPAGNGQGTQGGGNGGAPTSGGVNPPGGKR
jgi:hypothetical protein